MNELSKLHSELTLLRKEFKLYVVKQEEKETEAKQIKAREEGAARFKEERLVKRMEEML